MESVRLSLFEGDPFRSLLGRLHLPETGVRRTVFLSIGCFLVGWGIPCVLALISGRWGSNDPSIGFFYDLNMPMQTTVAVILTIAEPMLDLHVAQGGEVFEKSTLLRERGEYLDAAKELRRLREKKWPEIAAFVLAIFFVALWAIPAWKSNQVSQISDRGVGHGRLNALGYWEVFVWGPLFQFLWTRWLWKVWIWSKFLRRVSRTDLRLTAIHPDRAGGLAFLGDIQGAFAVLIFAMGLVVAADAATQLLRSDAVQLNIFFSVPAFLILGPVVFLGPLLFFTRTMWIARLNGLRDFEILLGHLTVAFEDQHAEIDQPVHNLRDSLQEFDSLTSVTSLHSHVSGMRVVPFDLSTVTRLILSAVTPVLPFAVRYLPWPELRDALNVILGR